MRLTVLGRSPASPNPGEACAGYLVEGGGDDADQRKDGDYLDHDGRYRKPAPAPVSQHVRRTQGPGRAVAAENVEAAAVRRRHGVGARFDVDRFHRDPTATPA